MWFELGAAGEAIVAAVAPSDSSAFKGRLVQSSRASFAKTRIDRGRQLVIAGHDGTRAQRFVIPHEVLTFLVVRPLPDDEVLVVVAVSKSPVASVALMMSSSPRRVVARVKGDEISAGLLGHRQLSPHLESCSS